MAIKVSIVDDDPWLLQTLELFLSHAVGFCFSGAYGNGDEALDHIPLTPPDIVLMDILMPGMSGIECTRQLKTALPSLKVIILTGLTEPLLITESVHAGADGYLTKPFSAGECVAAIHLVLAGGLPLSPSAALAFIGPCPDKNPARRRAQPLTGQEGKLMDILSLGLGDKQIADRMNLSVFTIETYLKRIYPKLGVHSRTAAVMTWLKIRKP